jgi:hypothetical protein
MNRNPFRKEGDAFYVLLVIGAAALAVIAVSAVISARVGAILGLILLCAGVVILWRWTKEAIGSDDEPQ